MIFKNGNKVFKNNGRIRITPDDITPGYVLFVDAKKLSSYPGTGTNWNDLSANNYDGTLVGSPAFVTTPRKSFQVDNAKTVNFTTANSLFGNMSRFTIDMFLSVPDFTVKNFIEKYQSGGNELIMGLFNSQLYAWILDQSTGQYKGRIVTNFQSLVSAGTMNQITFIWDGGTSPNNIQLFINGVQRDNATFASGGTFVSIKATATTLRIGGVNGGLGSSSTFNVSTLAVYNRVLNSQELLKNNTYYNK